MDLNSFREFDTVKISGTASSPSGLELDRVKAVISTIDPSHIKVWCDLPFPGNPYRGNCETGKVWIPKSQIKEITLVEPFDYD